MFERSERINKVGSMKYIDYRTGEVKKIAPRATPKQIAYIQSLERQLGRKVYKHNSKNMWKASKKIEELQKALDEQKRQSTIY